MIKIYGMPTCPYCDYVHEQVRGREDEFEYINIGENISNMGAFIRLRDAHTVDQFLHPFRAGFTHFVNNVAVFIQRESCGIMPKIVHKQKNPFGGDVYGKCLAYTQGKRKRRTDHLYRNRLSD